MRINQICIKLVGRVYRTYTGTVRNYRGHWLYLTQRRLTFRARSCMDIGILLITTSPDGWGRENYEVSTEYIDEGGRILIPLRIPYVSSIIDHSN